MIAIGIDVGGMSIKGGSVSLDGKVLETFTMPVIKGEKQDITINKLIDALKAFINKHHYEGQILGIGLGIPGMIDSPKGIVFASSNLKWENLPIVKMLDDAFHLPIRITNDANAAALGEAIFGAGSKYNSSIMITLGTGVGGGVIIDHKLFEGNEGKGTELGHMVIVPNGLPCGCGRKGCLEQYASASALIRETKNAMLEHKDSKMWNLVNSVDEVNGKTVFDGVALNDTYAKEVLDNYIFYLGEGLLNFCNIFRPNVIILSGGIAKQGENLNSRLRAYMADRNYGYTNSPAVDLVSATLGYNAGIIGAATLIINK